MIRYEDANSHVISCVCYDRVRRVQLEPPELRDSKARCNYHRIEGLKGKVGEMGPNGTTGQTGPAGHDGKGCTGRPLEFVKPLWEFCLTVWVIVLATYVVLSHRQDLEQLKRNDHYDP
ncbi:hypothetical protein NP493_536g00011 [Ridgeia piscesae]|uniref:Uncharacterized protein n=1 Tax=Ridgeia piscesae TaxID=27915 RepID=A0AAD9KVW0_RIDPI|nr:hypothetical protein NP493_536g00011 [Ridgeia piscesae]